MDAWSFDDDKLYNEKDHRVYTYLKKNTHNKELARNTAKLLDLYRYLSTESFKSPEELRNSVFLDSAHKEHAFTPEEANQVYTLLNPPQQGGAPQPEDVEVLDTIIMRWVYFIREWTPAFITDITDEITPYMFILKGLEENEEFGVLLGVALDATEAGLKTTAGAIQSLSPIIVGLLPLPEAGPIGAVLGWLVSSVFIVLLVSIHISRRHFGQAFIASFSLIPIVGQSLYNAAMSGERFLTKTSQKRQRLIESARKVLGDGVADTLEATIPDPLAPPPEESPAEGDDGTGQAALANAMQSYTPMGVGTASEGEDALAKEMQSYVPIAGKRFSKKHGKKPKWRTLRNRSRKHSASGLR